MIMLICCDLVWICVIPGIFAMWRRGNYALMFTLLGLIGYFVAVHLFHGNSRYRIPVEPAMILFSLYDNFFVNIFAQFSRSFASFHDEKRRLHDVVFPRPESPATIKLN